MIIIMIFILGVVIGSLISNKNSNRRLSNIGSNPTAKSKSPGQTGGSIKAPKPKLPPRPK